MRLPGGGRDSAGAQPPPSEEGQLSSIFAYFLKDKICSQPEIEQFIGFTTYSDEKLFLFTVW